MLEDVLEKWRRGQTGPLPHLTILQLLHALVLISEKAPVGRRTLAQDLEITDGTVRGLLERLGEQGIIQVASSGVVLTSRGKDLLQKHFKELGVKKIQFLGQSEFAPGNLATAIHLVGKYRLGMTGIPERDEAIKSGAHGSITIGVRRNRLVLPPDNQDVAKTSPLEDKRLREIFGISDNDLIIIGFAPNKSRSLIGALAVVAALARA